MILECDVINFFITFKFDSFLSIDNEERDEDAISLRIGIDL